MRLPIDRQQRKVIARSTERGGDYPIQADFGRNPRTTTVRVAAREEAAIGGCQRGTTSTEQNNQFDPGGSRVFCSFLPSGYLVCCMLFVHVLFLFSASFSCYHARFKRLQVFSTEGESDRDRRTRWMRSSVRAGHGSYRSLIQKGTVVYCCSYISDKFNDWGGRGCNIFVPVLGGNGTKIVRTGYRFDQPPGQMR